jgi:hypothetical protein
MVRRLIASVGFGLLVSTLSGNAALAQASAWRKADCSDTGIVLPAGKGGDCTAGPIEFEQGCAYETYAVGSRPGPGPRFRVQVKVGRDSAHFCSLAPPNTVARLKSRAGSYVERQAIDFSEPQSLADGTIVLFFTSTDTERDGQCFAFAKPERRQGVAYRSVLSGYFCAGKGNALNVAAAGQMLRDVRSTY